MNQTFLWLLFLFGVMAQASTTLPLFLFLLLLVYVFAPSSILFVIAYGMGVLLDILLLQTIGVSSAIGVGFLFLIFAYERKFEVKTPHFVFLATFIATVFWFFFFYHRLAVFPSLFSAFFVSVLFLLIRYLVPQEKSSLFYSN